MPAPARANYPDFLHHLIEHLSLVGDQPVCEFAHRTEQNNYGSEGWGFESLRARKTAGQWLDSMFTLTGRSVEPPMQLRAFDRGRNHLSESPKVMHSA